MAKKQHRKLYCLSCQFKTRQIKKLQEQLENYDQARTPSRD
jgi:hypothetical protein